MEVRRQAVAGLLCALALIASSAACGDRSRPSLPDDATVTGDADRGVRSTVAAFLTRIRAHDVDGVARLEVKPDDKDWRTAHAGSGWLVGNYADALRGAVRAEVRDETENEQQWHVCLRFGSPERSLRLTVLESGPDGHFSADGGHRKLLLSGFAEVTGAPKPNPSVRPGTFCAAGIVGPQWG